MRVRVEYTDEDEEVVIRCKHHSDRIAYLEATVRTVLEHGAELTLYIGDAEYYVPKDEILFFETYDGKVYAHTHDRMYATPLRLFEIERLMPPCFVRISKSAIANVKRIDSLRRELTGGGEITFRNSDKTIRFSRGYGKLLKDTIEEVRFT